METRRQKVKEVQERLIGRFPDPSPADLGDPRFNAIWEVIKGWDIGMPIYPGYMSAVGNHVLLILDALGRKEAE